MKVDSSIDAGWFRPNVPAETCQPAKHLQSMIYAHKKRNKEALLGYEDVASLEGEKISSDISKGLVDELFSQSPAFKERLISHRIFFL